MNVRPASKDTSLHFHRDESGMWCTSRVFKSPVVEDTFKRSSRDRPVKRPYQGHASKHLRA